MLWAEVSQNSVYLDRHKLAETTKDTFIEINHLNPTGDQWH